jgi:hypothetical protein
MFYSRHPSVQHLVHLWKRAIISYFEVSTSTIFLFLRHPIVNSRINLHGQFRVSLLCHELWFVALLRMYFISVFFFSCIEVKGMFNIYSKKNFFHGFFNLLNSKFDNFTRISHYNMIKHLSKYDFHNVLDSVQIDDDAPSHILVVNL